MMLTIIASLTLPNPSFLQVGEIPASNSTPAVTHANLMSFLKEKRYNIESSRLRRQKLDPSLILAER